MIVNNGQEVPVNIVGSSVFGRYPKISDEKTYNMFISDDWLVNYAGFVLAREILPAGQGRGLFVSEKGNFMLAVISSSVYKITTALVPQFIGNLDTAAGDVFLDENLNQQIGIADGQNVYIYSYITGALTKQTLTWLGNSVIPNYIAYHNTFFLIASNPASDNPQNWYAAAYATDNTITIAAEDQFSVQTKASVALAVKRLPGKGNNVIVLGSPVGEFWTQIGGAQNYARIQSANIDNGVESVSTIAGSDEFICWLGKNENNARSIMVTNGAQTERLSTDGIDYVLQNIRRPDKSTAFFYRKDGHLFYQLTFYDENDNLSLLYDFNTKRFFHVSDQNLNYYPARQVAYFNNTTYFVSINDGNLYEMSTNFLTYNYENNNQQEGHIIPRIRIPKTIRQQNNERFRCGMFTFWLEQGVTAFPATQVGSINQPRVDLSFSKNGNQSFSNRVSRPLNPQGHYKNQIRWHRLGEANEITLQLQFWGMQRFVAQDGILEVY